MKQKTILTWGISAIVYLGLVIGGYTVYASVDSNNGHTDTHSAETAKEEHTGDHASQENDGADSEHSDHGAHEESQVATNVKYENGLISINLKDKDQNAPELEISHEKIMHLIIVSADLEDYYHLHPEENGNGLYTQKFNLPENSYKVFIDIKPKNLAYEVKPIELNVGKGHGIHEDNSLKPDTNLTKTINEKTVELTTTDLGINKDVTLRFDTKGSTPEPYLGALGHVVILDENGEKFVHVHPASEEKTIFETTFDKPGIYKVWGEFKFDGKVGSYPFVIEVK
ncbi:MULTISPECIES: hypothetical protein [Bacillus]|uniref:Secreted protein n=2 Tax=Bacillus TaxID=1386 RepID=A0A0M4FR78_9BACI|nr:MULTISPECIES: hypothetical protein [Bacillus]ALC81935.1 hypothetical protein AM592_10210 [Bacillus gobiensis]MBP1083264.1 hypothetical protein [Bacillus capparidis]MED1097701.1 hypothetical protein [Bacillus capparidis]